ncbi:MAG: hypothetical protein LBI84_03990, partial [Propionibacteriaceae bacterium]|nr:hypothetical protein [Propionibacteriaceae bacterium]
MTAAAPPAGSLAPPGTGFSPADRPSLHRQLVGEGPILYVFCHGLFGQGRNWAGIARRLLPDASLLADLPNHGRSPWTSRLDCGDLAQSVVGLLKELRRDESNPKTTAYAAGPPAPDPAA